jgi:hypothetical protein
VYHRSAIPSISPNGVHSWSLPPEERSPVLGLPAVTSIAPTLPAGYVEDFAAELKVKKDGAGSRVVLPGGAQVIGDLDKGRMKIASVYFSEAIDMLIRAFGPGKVSNTGKFKLLVYRKREDFNRKAASLSAPNALSLYNPRTFEIELPWTDAFDEAWLGRILFHETTHAWMDICFGTTSPLWVAEGVAEYFSSFKFRGITEPGAAFDQVLAYLPKDPANTTEFMAGGRDVFYGPQFQAKYAQAWSLIAFLMEHDPDSVWDLLNRRSIIVDDSAYGEFYGQLLKVAGNG